MDWKDEAIAAAEAGQTPKLPPELRDKYQAYDGGHFPQMTLLYLLKLEDRVKVLEDIIKGVSNAENGERT